MSAACPLTCFKAYDIRGRVPDELNAAVAYRIARAFARFLDARRVVIGHDIRLSSPELSRAVSAGLRDSGVDVTDIGLCGTEEIYFATADGGVDGGIAITASHNPADYNGMKMVREGSRPISSDNGLLEIRDLAERNEWPEVTRRGDYVLAESKERYVRHLLGFVDVASLPPLRIVTNAGNGGAGSVIDALEPHLPFEFIKVHHEADGHFPNGVPNPLLPENRLHTADPVRAHGADFGVAWDGDFDRCFFFDEQGGFVEGYYIVGLLAEAFLRKGAPQRIVHDPRLTWNTIETVARLGGEAVETKTGHAFIKQTMRDVDAVYGGEMSAHHYFRDFAYCDSGMVPWLLVAELIGASGRTLSQLVAEAQAAFPVSGEINRTVEDPAAVLARVEQRYAPEVLRVSRIDGLGMDFADWRFSLRMSNTEPLLRLNVESRADPALMRERTEELLDLIRRMSDVG